MIHHQHIADEVLGATGNVIPLTAGEAVLALHDLADHLQPLSENCDVSGFPVLISMLSRGYGASGC